jgi:hypothetical protein
MTVALKTSIVGQYLRNLVGIPVHVSEISVFFDYDVRISITCYISANIIRATKSRMGRAGHVARRDKKCVKNFGRKT